MIIGDPRFFAIESRIKDAYESLGLLALGFFILHVGGRSYGQTAIDSTMLACSFNAVEERLTDRGKHTAPFAAESDAGKIADAFRNAIYSEEQEESYFGISRDDFCNFFYVESNDRMWAPDGDEAFDDGSFVLQFDVEDHVRLIAFRCWEEPGREYLHDPATLSDVWLKADDFYRILQEWRDAFKAEWMAAKKVVS